MSVHAQDISKTPLEAAELDFERMRQEWQGVKASVLDATITGWTDSFDNMRREQSDLMGRGLWVSGPSDLLSVIGYSRKETFHSAVIAWLLDPSMPHGMNSDLLARVLVHCFPDDEVPSDCLGGAVSECEVTKPSTRADIVVTASDLTLVIEVKVDAVEREAQCDDLYSDWGESAGARFIFLTPDGRRPRTASGDAEESFACLSLRTLRDILAEILQTGGSAVAPGRAVAQTYLATLREEFP
jgi:hypothetical protein